MTKFAIKKEMKPNVDVTKATASMLMEPLAIKVSYFNPFIGQAFVTNDLIIKLWISIAMIMVISVDDDTFLH